MGLSASQARLLSLTARLTDNELSSQMITNAKLRLASKSAEASDEYMNALNATMLNFKYYDSSGEAKMYDLTPGFLYTYSPLKNQYSIQNANGVNLVSATDAENYEKTDNLSDFLDCYDLLESVTKTHTKSEINPAWQNWVQEHETWVEAEPHPDDFTTKEPDTIITERVNTSPIYPALTSTISTCFNIAISEKNCYMHVLAALIGVGEHTTTTGETYEVTYDTWDWNTYSTSEEIGQTLRDSLFNDTCSSEAYNGPITTNYGTVICKGDGSDSKKYNNVYQKAVDLLWEVHEEYDGTATGGEANPESLAKFFYFIEFDLGESFTDQITIPGDTIFDKDGYLQAQQDWENGEPLEPPKTINVEYETEEIVINDKDKAQWYTNLWYILNGSDTANLVKEDDDDTTNSYFVVKGAEKNAQKTNYKVLDEALLNDASWLQFALESGAVSLKKAEYYNPAENSGKVPETDDEGINWKSVIYTSTSDIFSFEDKNKITKAQVNYQNATKEIESKDKEYDIKLKNLDTVHNALLTEYESIKNVISKNAERSFKTFS